MLFEFDENKSKINKQKHGIDFVEARQLFNKKTKIIPAKEIEDEIRYAAIGYIDNKCYVMIFTALLSHSFSYIPLFCMSINHCCFNI